MHELRHMTTDVMRSADAEDPDIRILRRVSTLNNFPLAMRGDGPIHRIAVVDCETTGTDPATDEVIDIAVVMLEVDTAGEIVGIASAGQALRDPGMPIPAAITRLTGIADEDVRGKAIDLDRLERLLASADVRLAHNARFDIAFVEQLLPGLAGAAWGCSATDFDWVEAGFDGYKQNHLLMQLGFFNTAHRAMADVVSLIHLIAHRLPHGGTVLGDLLVNAAQQTIRFEATAAPFERRSQLKARGYRWDSRHRVWWCEIAQHDCASEERWFREHISPSGPVPRMTEITWHQRHR
jgi:DNA polymerase-3 subunit epsilon